MTKNNFKKTIAAVALCLITASCATNLSKDHSTLQPSKAKFGKFNKVEIKAVSVSEKFAKHSANRRAVRKIDDLLQRDIKMVFNNAIRIEKGSEFSKTKEPTLQITPHVEEIKFISGAVRFWAGWFAGGSAALMKVTFVDSSTGQVIAEPEFYRDANAFAGGMTLGRADNDVLSAISQDVVNYSSNNR